MYSRQDPVGVKVKYMGSPGIVNKSDPVSVKNFPGKDRGVLNYIPLPRLHSTVNYLMI